MFSYKFCIFFNLAYQERIVDHFFQITQPRDTILKTEFYTAPYFNQVLKMKIFELNIHKGCVNQNTLVPEVAQLFGKHPDWPGIIIADENQFFGMVSRQRCFEVLGKPFGIEVFTKKTILDFLNMYGSYNLILDSKISVQEAVKAALGREHDMIYEPIVVRMDDHRYGLLDMHTLLLGQSDLLEKLYNEVQDLSIKDPLTNLSNRRGFFDAAQPILEESQNTHTHLAALMVDIDNFKLINDVYGHFIGDQIICAVADACKKILRQTDLICRFGGEEFIALLPGTSIDGAVMIAERLRKKVEEQSFEVNGIRVMVTVSIGICHIQDACGSLDTLLNQADQAMYQAKTAGRNQVAIWRPDFSDSLLDDISKSASLETDRGEWPSRIDTNNGKFYDETIEGWARALELRDKEMQGHAQRVVHFTIELAKRYGVPDNELINIRRGALLHDIGKIAIPDPILFKPGPLTEDEWIVMRKHPVHAYEMLSPITFLQGSLDIPYCHHEHWDGSGYPRGLSGEEIPLAARIFTIIDVWDALSSDRCYRPAWKTDEIQEYIIDQSGKLFDPNITPTFLRMLNEINTGEIDTCKNSEISKIVPDPMLERKPC